MMDGQDAYAAAKVQLRSKTFSEAEIPLTDGENKVFHIQCSECRVDVGLCTVDSSAAHVLGCKTMDA